MADDAGDPVRSSLRALVAQWREKAALTEMFHASMGLGWGICADDLEAVIASLPAPPPARPAGEPT